jgi:hypothetical protein
MGAENIGKKARRIEGRLNPGADCVQASATCSITSTTGLTMLNLSTEYDLLPPTVGNGQQKTFLKLDPKEKASLWWGASLLLVAHAS